MTIKSIEEKPKRKREIDLTGPQGNAYYLLAIAKIYSGKLKKDFNKIQSEMTSGNYEHLISIFKREFGEFVRLRR